MCRAPSLFSALLVAASLVTGGAAEAADGAALYARYCALCHGAAGEGYAADNATRLNGPELLGTATDEFLTLAIALGRTETAMAAYLDDLGGPLSQDEIASIVSYLRDWQHGPAVSLPDSTVEGDPERGAVVYAEHCAVCHGTLAEGGSAQSLNRWAFLSEASDGFLRYAVAEGRADTPMPAFADELASAEIDDVVAFLRRFEQEPDAVPASLQPPPVAKMPIVVHPEGPPASFELREGRYVAAASVREALSDGARLVLLDARTTSDWLIERLPGSIPVPYYDDPGPIVDLLPRDDTWILAYCGCPHAASGQVVDALRKLGFERTAVIDEGFFHWVDEGYPTERGAWSPR